MQTLGWGPRKENVADYWDNIFVPKTDKPNKNKASLNSDDVIPIDRLTLRVVGSVAIKCEIIINISTRIY